MMNPMTQGRYQPIPSQAEITRKCTFDVAEARQRKANSEDNMKARHCYPGGGNNNNLWVMPGEIVFGKRKLSHFGTIGRPSELGMTSLAGLHTDGKPVEQLMDEYYFIGIAKTEFEFGGDNMWHNDPLDHGFSVIGSGSCSTINRSNENIYPGDLLVWDFPPLDNGTQILPVNVKATSAAGPFTKVLPYLRRYIPENTMYMGTALNRILSAEPTPENQKLYDLAVALQDAGYEIDQYDAANRERSAATPEELNALLTAAFKLQRRQLDRVVGIALGPSAPGQTLDVMLSHYKCY